jgi:hypothetical protein
LITKNELETKRERKPVLEELAGLEALPRQFTPAARKLSLERKRRDEAPACKALLTERRSGEAFNRPTAVPKAHAAIQSAS